MCHCCLREKLEAWHRAKGGNLSRTMIFCVRISHKIVPISNKITKLKKNEFV